MSPQRPAAAGALGAALAALLAAAPAAAALESLELRLGSLRGDSWAAAGVTLRLDLDPDGAPRSYGALLRLCASTRVARGAHGGADAARMEAGG